MYLLNDCVRLTNAYLNIRMLENEDDTTSVANLAV